MKINLIVGANEAKMLPPLSIILGQYQLPGQKVCSEINKLTEKFKQGVSISLFIEKVNSTEYNICVKGPTLSFLISQSVTNSAGIIPIEVLFDIFRFIEMNNLINSKKRFIEKDIFSTLRSCRLSPNY